jgi:stage V sporulation protein AB
VILQIFIGFSAGLVVAGGVFAFVNSIGVFVRLAAKTQTVQHLRLYEDCMTIGAAAGNYVSLFEPKLWGGTLMTVLWGLGSGIFLGCLIMSIAETLNALPAMTRNIKLRRGIQYVILSMALGKMAGALIFFYTT